MSDDPRQPTRDRYFRPNQAWECGRIGSDEDPCTGGPLPGGKCCRSDNPCVPRSTLRRKRQRLILGTVVLLGGWMLLNLTSSAGPKFLSSGPLSSQHARLADAHGGCQACHEDTENGWGQWFVTLTGWQGSVGRVSSQKCLQCHDDLFPQGHANDAHNVHPDDLREITLTKGQGKESFHRLFAANHQDANAVQCTACHREHHGKDHDLKALTTRQCQTCHADTFESFSAGHPDFAEWTYQRRPRIAFDHGAHEALHFPQRAQTFACNQCHVPDSHGDAQLLVGYEQTCASCHDNSIEDSLASGMPILALPILDTQWLAQQGIDMGAWPESASGMFDGGIPPAMKLMLLSDDRAVESFRVLGEDFDLADLDPDDPAQLQAVGQLALAIRALVTDLKREGPVALQQRWAAGLGDPSDQEALRRVTDGVPAGYLAAVAHAWFPDEAGDLGSVQAGPQTSRAARTASFRTVEPIQDQDNSEWLADNPLKELMGNQPPPEMSPSDRTPPVQVIPPPDGNARPPRPPEQSAGEPTDTMPPDDPMADVGTRQENLDSNESPPPSVPDVANAVSTGPGWLRSGNWEYDQQRLALVYHPAGHADEWMKHWIELVFSIPEGERGIELREAIARVHGDVSLGRCTDCHSIDAAEDQSWSVQWRAARPDPAHREFTRFVHRPHLVQPELADCRGCHKFDPTIDVSANYHGRDPFFFRSEFTPIRKVECASCHNDQQASDQCTTCHNYHVHSHRDGSTR